MAVGDAYVSCLSHTRTKATYLSFQSHRLLFSHASANVRGENTPERNFASTGDRTHNHQVISPTRSPLCHPGGAKTKGGNLATFYHSFQLWSLSPKNVLKRNFKLNHLAATDFPTGGGQYRSRSDYAKTYSLIFDLQCPIKMYFSPEKKSEIV